MILIIFLTSNLSVTLNYFLILMTYTTKLYKLIRIFFFHSKNLLKVNKKVIAFITGLVIKFEIFLINVFSFLCHFLNTISYLFNKLKQVAKKFKWPKCLIHFDKVLHRFFIRLKTNNIILLYNIYIYYYN